jgi:hypothetical protein
LIRLARQCRRTQLLHRERGREREGVSPSPLPPPPTTTTSTLRTRSSTNRQNRAVAGHVRRVSHTLPWCPQHDVGSVSSTTNKSSTAQTEAIAIFRSGPPAVCSTNHSEGSFRLRDLGPPVTACVNRRRSLAVTGRLEPVRWCTGERHEHGT